MEKSDFKEHTRYTLTISDEQGKLRPLNIYLLKMHPEHMIVRLTDREGILKKFAYSQVQRIVRQQVVSSQNQYSVPDALLSEKNWADRTEIQHYSSMPHSGK